MHAAFWSEYAKLFRSTADDKSALRLFHAIIGAVSDWRVPASMRPRSIRTLMITSHRARQANNLEYALASFDDDA